MNRATCKFCGRSFRNQQAVRAHLRSCPAYRQRPKAALPSIGSQPKPPAGVRVRERSAQLIPASIPPPDRPVRPTPRIDPEHNPRPFEKELHRSKIQSVKEEVIGSSWWQGHTISSDTKAQALVAIEQELSRLPADLPRRELVTIAEGLRDRLYKPVIQAQQRAREEEERKRNQARQRTSLITAGVSRANRTLRQQQDLDGRTRLDLEGKVKRALEQEVDGNESEADIVAWVDDFLAQQLEPIGAKRREQDRQRLIAYGVTHVRQELEAEEDLAPWERKSIERDVKRDLEQAVTGQESEGDVEVFVDEVLEQLLGEPDEEDEEDEEVEGEDDDDEQEEQ